MNIDCSTYGLFYVDRQNTPHIYINKLQDEINLQATIFHEWTHWMDFYMLSIYESNEDYRSLMEDTCFVLWSEFHVNYLMNSYLISIGKNGINVVDILFDIFRKISEFDMSNQTQKAADFSCRQFGCYTALCDHYPIPTHPEELFLSAKLRGLYNYSFAHRTLESICGLNGLTKALEQINQQAD